MHRVAHMDELIHGCPLVELIIVCFLVDHCCLWLALWDCRLWLVVVDNGTKLVSAVLHFTQNEGFINHKKDRCILWESN